MFIDRLISQAFHTAMQQFPAVLLTGARQAGKTTFLLHELKESASYVSFDDPLERSVAAADPNGFLERFKDKSAILDEIQYLPEILPYLKIRIDRNRRSYGKWILTGSQQFQLMKNVTESLAGRIAILDLLPFSLLEYDPGKSGGLDEVIWNGGYPEPALAPEKRDLWVRSYIQTYIERDVRQIQNIKDLRVFELFLSLAAAAHGRVFQTAEIARQCGASLPTIKAWIGILEASFLCFLLPPYFRNYGKRLVKTPKLYFIDSALACALTRQPDGRAALAGPMGGSLLEGFIVAEAVKAMTMKGERPNIFFWRSHDGLEVDLIVQAKGKLHPIEVKLTATPTLRHFDPLNRFKALAGDDAAEKGILVCQIDRTKDMTANNIAMPWHEFPAWLWSMLNNKGTRNR